MKPVKLSTLCALPFAFAASAHALTFDFGDTSALGSDLTAALARAGGNWSSRIADNVTVKINFGLGSLPVGAIGGTSSFSSVVSYSDFRNALASDAKSSTDTKAVASLGAGSTYSAVVNTLSGFATGQNVNLSGLSGVRINTANQHALGLLGAYTGPDANMVLSNSLSFDFNPDDGISAGAFDFVGVVTHELGHALGFGSGVDTFEAIFAQNGAVTGSQYNSFTTSLDLFRYTGFNGGALPLRNLGLGDVDKFFSVDGGQTMDAQFATGMFGDGGQASHWKDGLDLGVMDPTANLDGTTNPISLNDLMALDAIGYDIKPVPEPATFVALGAGLVALARRQRR